MTGVSGALSPPDRPLGVEPLGPPTALTSVAEQVFGLGLERARVYASWLAGAAITRGLLGPAERPRLWERHLLNAAVLSELVPSASRVLDVGSGAGLPGIALALARPDLDVTLLEPALRRVRFLQECLADLELPNVRVERARAEHCHGRLRADVVTARAVAPLSRLVPVAMPLVAAGGALLAIKGSTAAVEISDARSVLRVYAATACVLECGTGVLPQPTTVVRIVFTNPTTARRRGTGR